MVQAPMSATAYSLIFVCKVVVILEIQVPCLLVALTMSMTMNKNYQHQLKELEVLVEKQFQAQQFIKLYQA